MRPTLVVISRDPRHHHVNLDQQRPVPVLSVVDRQVSRGSWGAASEFRPAWRAPPVLLPGLSGIRRAATWLITTLRWLWRRSGRLWPAGADVAGHQISVMKRA